MPHSTRRIGPDRAGTHKVRGLVGIGVRAIFWRGAGSILPEKYGAAPEKWTPELTWLNRTRQESLTTSIVENRWRTYIYVYIVLLSSIFVKHALNSHFVKYIPSVYNNVTTTIGGSEIYIILHNIIRKRNWMNCQVLRFTGIFYSIYKQCTTIDPRPDNKRQLSTFGFPVRMPHSKVLGFRAFYFAVAYGIFFIFFIYNF